MTDRSALNVETTVTASTVVCGGEIVRIRFTARS
jgi:hypothetical protein